MNIDLSPVTKSQKFCSFLGINQGEDVGFEILGHGEYNLNYLFRRPSTGEKLVLRIPMGSQMHLDNQVRYEYEALLLLEPTGRTPRPLYIDDTKSAIPYGFLVMGFIPGRPLRYEDDLQSAALCLAEIHNHGASVKSHHLLMPENPLAAILQESETMADCYMQNNMAGAETKRLLLSLLEQGQKIVRNTNTLANSCCIINTELNSSNFLVDDAGKKTHLVDWEKPLFACPGQDLGHFLAPTTTLWKTDTILGEEEIHRFVQDYCAASSFYSNPENLWEQTKPYFVMNCLRGVTWCSMAFIEYNGPDRVLKDAFTFEKIKTYISPEFLERILNEHFLR